MQKYKPMSEKSKELQNRDSSFSHSSNEWKI